jgi:Lamin Tail Domain/FlgD Ig-like domain
MGRTPRFDASLLASALVALALPALTLTLIPRMASAQVVINELLPNPSGDDTGTERIEIYNAGSTPVDMTGWAIDDAATIDNVAVRCRIPEDFDTALCPGSVIIGPGEFRVLKGTSTAAFLNNTGDDVYLVSNRVLAATVVHFVHYPSASVQVDSTWSALPNGTSNFAWRGNTLCASNGNTGDIVPPATVSDLLAVPGSLAGEVRLTWTSPGDDGLTGTASGCEFKVSHNPITSLNFDAANDLQHWINEPLPLAGGTPDTLIVFGLSPDSTWYFALRTQDEVPNTSGVSNSSGTAPQSGALLNPDLGYQTYFGNLHSHTSYSDGVQTPPDAWNFARNTAPTPLDFLAVTDHNHLSAGMSLPSYALGLAAADAANDDGNFVAIYGQEWGLASHGHINVFQAPVLFGWDPGNYDVFVAEGDYLNLYTEVLAHPPASYPPIGEFCHPAPSDFSSLAMSANAKALIHLMAVVNGPATSVSTTESDIGNTGYDAIFQEALRKGFRVSPTADQDNHNATWGASSQSRTAVLALSKTKSAILTALAARRCYATQDHNARVAFSAEGHAMGEAFTSAQGIRIAAQVTDPDVGAAVAQIELFRGVTFGSNATRVAFNDGNSTLQWRERSTFAPGTEVHYYLRIRTVDNRSIWTGPVYVTYDPNFQVAVGNGTAPVPGLSLSALPNPSTGRLTAGFTLPRAVSHAALAVYDPSGRLVRTLLDRPLEAGEHHVTWDGVAEDGTRAHTGVFFLRLQTNEGSISHRILLLR